ncbi:MAG: response regulator transcription factor [Clostridia bacterium]|nr:response regulator transcription factor [Clostridia bacterium]
MKLLLAEDTFDLSRAVAALLRHDGYEVDQAYDGVEASAFLEKGSYDGIILDIMMPRKDGLAVLRDLREAGITTPVLMLTAKAEINDRVTGLEMGADDYLTKPFAMKEFLARIHSMTRRRAEYSNKDLRFGNISLNADSFELRAENSIRLSVKEFELMQSLMMSAGKPQSTQYLFERVWHDDTETNENVVWVYISYLRNKLRSVNANVVIDGERGGSFTLIEG